MPVYCYIVETGYYEDLTANILGHTEKYSQEEFDNICIEITKEHGDVEEIAYFSPYDKSDVEEIVYKIEGEDLIKYLVNEYGFIELDVPVNDGHNRKEISRKRVPQENLKTVGVKPVSCPVQDEVEHDVDSVIRGVLYHPNARCIYSLKKED